MALFILGLIIFFGAHSFTAFARGPRARLVAKLGEGPYKGLYSLASVLGFALIIVGWRGADASVLYSTPPFLRHVTYVLMLTAMVLIVAAYAPKGRIAHAAKHPMLLAVKVWAIAHLLVNGEVRSVLLFGAFLAYAAADRVAVKRRGAPVPAAGPWRNDAAAVVAGAAAFGAILFYLHRYIAGVALV